MEAKDMGSLGFGAQAEDHLCSIADQVVKVRGVSSDIAMRAMNRPEMPDAT